MVKVRIHEIAKELGIKSKEVVEKATDIGLSVKSASSAINSDEAEALMNFVLTGTKPEAKEPKAKPVATQTPSEPKASQETKTEKIATPKEPEAVESKEVPKKTAPAPEKPKPAIKPKQQEPTIQSPEEPAPTKKEPVKEEEPAKEVKKAA